MDKIAERMPVSVSWYGLRRRATDHHLAIELIETAKLASPMVLTHLGQIAMMTTDLALIGRLGAEAVAAAALAGRVYSIGIAFGVGLLAVTATLAAQAFGSENPGLIRRLLRMGLWAALLLSLPIMLVALHGEKILLALGQGPDAARLGQQYLFGLAWGVAPALCFLALRSFMGAVNRPKSAFWITLAAIPVNALLVYLLTYGKLGVPRLELFGAGLATTLVNFATFFAGLWLATMCRPFRDYHILAHLWRFDWPSMQQIIVLGTPISIAFLIEYGLSSAAALLAGLIGTAALAAHQIAFQVSAILFMIPTGISMAAAVRVAHALGRNDGPGVKRAGLAAILLGAVSVAILTLAVVVARFEIAEFFLGEAGGDTDSTVKLAARLLLVGASSFVAAAVYSIAAGTLRGLKDTRLPLLLSIVAYWPIGFSLSYLLGLEVGLGAIGIWIGLSIGRTVCATLLVLRFHLLASRLGFQSRYMAS
ncbi:MATE family efflux transporter [Bradyrhizobium sp. STM 3562]|uniref:MATE family efflux transporter n=1 Tax=Bradyrhizobium sp. STM 3562 TaxID=578924 RepID=UPI00388E5A80